MEAGHHLYLQFIQNVALFYHGVDIRVSLDIISFMKLLLWRKKISIIDMNWASCSL